MIHYRRNKPTRFEAKVALELYKPHDYEKGNMPEIQFNNTELYKPRVCWWTFKGRKLIVTQHICGLPATLYSVIKTGDNYSVGTAVNMYLCDKHSAAIKTKGYIATVVTK